MIKLDKLFFAIVEDVNDPLFFGRLRIRVYGVHNADTSSVPVESLPWADCMMSLPNPFISGIGLSPTGMVNGAMVLAIPKDPEFLQEWIVIGSLGGVRKSPTQGGFRDPKGEYPRINVTTCDTNILARGTTGANVEVLPEGEVGTGIFPSGYGAAVDKIANQTKTTVQEPIDTGTTPPPVEPPKSATPWMDVAINQLGVNNVDNPDKIKEYHSQGGGSSTWGGNVAWCSSYCNWVLKQVGIKGTMLPNARSWVNYGTDVMQDKGKIPYGSIIVIAGNRGPSSGHVCFATGIKGERIQVIGGNQGSKNPQAGGEVTNSSFPLSAVIAARFPIGYKPQ